MTCSKSLYPHFLSSFWAVTWSNKKGSVHPDHRERLIELLVVPVDKMRSYFVCHSVEKEGHWFLAFFFYNSFLASFSFFRLNKQEKIAKIKKRRKPQPIKKNDYLRLPMRENDYFSSAFFLFFSCPKYLLKEWHIRTFCLCVDFMIMMTVYSISVVIIWQSKFFWPTLCHYNNNKAVIVPAAGSDPLLFITPARHFFFFFFTPQTHRHTHATLGLMCVVLHWRKIRGKNGFQFNDQRHWNFRWHNPKLLANVNWTNSTKWLW